MIENTQYKQGNAFNTFVRLQVSNEWVTVIVNSMYVFVYPLGRFNEDDVFFSIYNKFTELFHSSSSEFLGGRSI